METDTRKQFPQGGPHRPEEREEQGDLRGREGSFLRERKFSVALCAQCIFQNGPHAHSHQRSLCVCTICVLGTSSHPSPQRGRRRGGEKFYRIMRKSSTLSRKVREEGSSPSSAARRPAFPASAHSPEPALRVEAEGCQGRSHGDPGRTPSRPGTPPGSLRPTRGPPRSSATEKRFPLSPGSRLQKCKFISK